MYVWRLAVLNIGNSVITERNLHSISLTKRQFVVTHAIRQPGTPALLNIYSTNTPSVKMSCPQKYCLFLYFGENLTPLSVSLSRIDRVLSPVKFHSGGLWQIAVVWKMLFTVDDKLLSGQIFGDLFWLYW